MLARSFTSISRNYRLFEIYSLVFSQITSFGVLVGHRLLRNYVYSSWMIYGFRHDLLIISISTFINMLRIGFLFLDTAVFAGSPIWFAGKDKIYSYLSEFAAISCGEFSCTIDWINGVLSNFYVVFNSLRTLTKLSKNIRPRKYINIDLSNWLFTRFSWPRVVFVASVLNSFFISSEATALKIPCIGIVDTNAPSQTTTIAIPGNDDSLNAVLFYNEIVSSFIMFRKAFNVLMWFVSIRRSSRVLTFFDWFSNKLREGLFFKNQPKSSFSDVNLKTPFLTNSNNFSLRFFLYRGTPFNLLAFSLTKFYKTLKMEKTSDFFNSFASSHHSIISSFSLDFFRKAFFKKYNTLFSKHLFYKPLSKIKYGFRPFFRGLKRFNANSKKFDLLRLFQKDFYTKPNQRKPFDFVRHSWNKAFKNFWQFNYNHCNSLLRLFFNFFFFLFLYRVGRSLLVHMKMTWRKFFFESKRLLFFSSLLRSRTFKAFSFLKNPSKKQERHGRLLSKFYNVRSFIYRQKFSDLSFVFYPVLSKKGGSFSFFFFNNLFREEFDVLKLINRFNFKNNGLLFSINSISDFFFEVYKPKVLPAGSVASGFFFKTKSLLPLIDKNLNGLLNSKVSLKLFADVGSNSSTFADPFLYTIPTGNRISPLYLLQEKKKKKKKLKISKFHRELLLDIKRNLWNFLRRKKMNMQTLTLKKMKLYLSRELNRMLALDFFKGKRALKLRVARDFLFNDYELGRFFSFKKEFSGKKSTLNNKMAVPKLGLKKKILGKKSNFDGEVLRRQLNFQKKLKREKAALAAMFATYKLDFKNKKKDKNI